MKAVLDTNFLIECIKRKARIEIAEKIYVIDKVVSELEKISLGKGKNGVYAKICLKWIKMMGLRVLKTAAEGKRGADSALLDYSQKGYIVLTQDRLLRERIKGKKGKSGFLRQGKVIAV